MMNLIDNYTTEATTESEEGVVAIEYVIMAGLVAIGVALAFGTTLWSKMLTKLDSIVFP